MKHFLTFFSLIVIAVYMMACHASMVVADSRSESTIPQSGDLCGGTGGNGQIVNIGSNGFTLNKSDTGQNLVVHLVNQAEIKTSAGLIKLSDLKIGERVTLVGSPNQDSSFTAEMVVVCSGPQTYNATQAAQLRQAQAGSQNRVKAWSFYITASVIVLACLAWLASAVFLARKKKKSLVYLLFFTVFYIYIAKVLDYTLFQFQSLILLKQLTSGLMLNGQTAEKSLNLIPLITLRLVDVKTSLLNILLMLPFGFGLPFITNFRVRKVVLMGMLFSIGIECLQFITGRIGGITFRIADVNDVIFNTVGVAIGYLLFVAFMRNYRKLFRGSRTLNNPILAFIAKRPQLD